MLLVVDIGNTSTILGIYDGDELIHYFTLESARDRTTDELHVLLTNLMHIAEVPVSSIHHSIVASVVPALTETVAAALKRAFGHTCLTVGPGIRTGMPILYENPREVGADRVVNGIAAYERVRSGVIAIDFSGTATVFDCVSNRGEYLGGVIAPGITISAEALCASAAKLPRTEIVKPPRVLGRNTVDSIRSGMVYGYVSLVDGLVQRLQKEIGYPCTVLGTGAMADLIKSESTTIDEVVEHLTLEGLKLLFERNR